MRHDPDDSLLALSVGRAVRSALDPDQALDAEELDVRLWRFYQLSHDGYGVHDAVELARADYVDLELACTLVSKLGCPPKVATRILL